MMNANLMMKNIPIYKPRRKKKNERELLSNAIISIEGIKSLLNI